MTHSQTMESKYLAALQRLRENPNWIDIQCIVPPEMTGVRFVMADIITVVITALGEDEADREYRHWTSADV